MRRALLLITVIFLWGIIVSAQTVYVTKTGSKYHSAGCSYLKSSIPISLDEAVSRSYTPCSRCSPQVKSVTTEDKLTQKEVKKESSEQIKTSSRCLATTKKGTQCKRNAKAGSNYCWQHQR